MELKDACSVEGKLWKLGSVLNSRDITLLTKIHIIKAMAFPLVMYGCEKAECQRIDAFELW